MAAETEYAFRHVLVRDVAYGQIPRRERAAKHLAVAGWIEISRRTGEDHAEMLAHHYQRRSSSRPRRARTRVNFAGRPVTG